MEGRPKCQADSIYDESLGSQAAEAGSAVHFVEPVAETEVAVDRIAKTVQCRGELERR